MPEKRETFWLYKDLYQRLSDMADKDAGELFFSILAHANGEEMIPQSPAAQMAWSFIKFELDRAEEYHMKIVERNRKANAARYGKNDANAYQSVPNSTTLHQSVPNDAEKEKEKENIYKEKYIKEKSLSFGQYGWVKLTEPQHKKLEQDLGKSELERCIAYVDESAQSTGNKNRWKDWNLVLRKCSREGWGRKSAKPKASGWGKSDEDLDLDQFLSLNSAL